MIGPYYKPQLTSMLSITHRATGVFLTVGALALVWWLTALSMGAAAYGDFQNAADHVVGKLVMAATVFSLVFHFLNGLRHLMWDTGYGLDIPKAYATGYAVIAGSVLLTVVIFWFAFGGAR